MLEGEADQDAGGGGERHGEQQADKAEEITKGEEREHQPDGVEADAVPHQLGDRKLPSTNWPKAKMATIMTEGFVQRWRDRMINIHPSLLPAYKGLHTHERALADKVTRHGCSVHFVRSDVDSGPLIAQASVPVLKSDTPETLAARVLDAEHKIYPRALALVASGAVRVEGETLIATKPGLHIPLIIP